jgi:hypothetical protein
MTDFSRQSVLRAKHSKRGYMASRLGTRASVILQIYHELRGPSKSHRSGSLSIVSGSMKEFMLNIEEGFWVLQLFEL